MGYTITIGELEVVPAPDDGIDSDCILFSAVGVTLVDAPAFGEPTDNTNSRWPSYSAWADTMRDTGLYDVFYHDSGTLIGNHPGVRLVTSELVARVELALSSYRISHPQAAQSFDDTDESANLCRLIWLDYWLRWSFTNCKTPVIANS